MARYRTYTIEPKRQVAEEHLGGGTSLKQLARRHDVSRELLRILQLPASWEWREAPRVELGALGRTHP